jgi:hypothetical protein
VKLPIKHDFEAGKINLLHVTGSRRVSVANRICRIVAGLLINASMC